jgi:hypothetical protein
MKYYDPNQSAGKNAYNTVKAFKLAVALNVDVINYSGGGTGPIEEERVVIEEALSKGIKVIVAAGNEHCNMDFNCTYYPAMYDDRIIVVGNLGVDRVPAKSSNSGSIVNNWEIGVDVLSYCLNSTTKKCKMTGTSQATAIHSGKVIEILDETYKNLDIDKVIALSNVA